MAPKIDFGIQGLPHEEVEQDEEKSRRHYIGRLVSAIINHEKDALNAELQSKHPYTPFSEESNRFFILGEVSKASTCAKSLANFHFFIV